MDKIKNIFGTVKSKTAAVLKRLIAALQKNKVCAAIIEKIKALSRIVWTWAKKHKILAGIVCLVLVLILSSVVSATISRHKAEDSLLIIKAEKRDIEETIDGSTIVEPNDEYSITPMVSGEILAAPFEEGDHVNKGDLLYKVDASTVEKNIQSADIAIAKAKKAYDDAVNENNKTVRDYDTTANTVKSAQIAVEKAQQAYNDALRDREDANVKATHSGVIKTLYVSRGDNISAGTKIADIVDSNILSIDVPFNTADADYINVGDSAVLTLTKSGSTVYGTVSKVGSLVETGSGYTSFRKITIDALNPGAVSSGDTATAMVGDIACNDIGTFEYITDDTVTAPTSGKVQNIYITENSSVTIGEVILSLDPESANSKVTSARLSLEDANIALEKAKAQQKSGDASTDIKSNSLNSSVENAKRAYDDAVISKEKLEKQLEDYNITAPISGTVVTKNMKQGDKIGSGSSSSSLAAAAGSGSGTGTAAASSSSSSALAVIYDMSRLKCTLNVDELDVKKISLGQKVTITADVSDKEYIGTVENIGVEGTVGSNGVTTYPIKIDIIDFDDALLPGMNIDAKIVVSSVHNALAVPISSVNRGNTVYVKGDKTDDNDKAPDGYRTVQVVTGISDGSFIEVSGDIKDGDELYSDNSTIDPMQQMQEMHDSMAEGGAPGGGGPGGGGPGGGGGMR